MISGGAYTNAINSALSMGYDGTDSWIQSRTTATFSQLYLNRQGGTVNTGGSLAVTGQVTCGTDYGFLSGTAGQAGMFAPRIAAQTPDTGMFLTGSLANSFIIAEYADRSYDFAHALQTNPTLYFQSANQSATEWGSLAHDQSAFVIGSGNDIALMPTSNYTGFGHNNPG
jgi:hypothetical protein